MLKLPTLGTRANIAIALVLIIGLVLMLTYCSGKRDGRAQIEQQIDRANEKAEARNKVANERANDARVTDGQAVLELREELTDAVEDTPDTMPTERRIARGCVQLRRSGRDTSTIPACAGY